MGRIIGVYGVIAGVTVALLMRAAMMLFPEGGTEGMVAGFSSMIIALTFVFIGTKRYRDVELGGVIRFGKALAVGFAIAAIATVFYVAAWELYLYFTDYTFMDEYTRAALKQAQEAGKSAAEIAALAKEMDGFKALYVNPFSRMAVTAMEISPIAGLFQNLNHGIQKPLRIKRCHTAGACAGDGLAIDVIHHVAACKDAGNAGLGRLTFGTAAYLDIAAGHIKVPFKNTGVGLVPDGDEDTMQSHIFGAAAIGCSNSHSGDATRVAQNLIKPVVPLDRDFALCLAGEQPVLQDFLRL